MASFYLPWKPGSFLLQGWYTRLKGRIDRSLWIFGSFPVRVHRREFHFRWPVHVKWVRRKWIHATGCSTRWTQCRTWCPFGTLAFHSSSSGRTAIHQFVSTSLPISLYIEGLTCSIAMTSTTVIRTFNSSSWFEGFNFCFHFLPAEFSVIQPISSWVWQNAHQTLAGGTRWTRAGWRFQRALSRDLHGPGRPSRPALHGVRGTRGVPTAWSLGGRPQRHQAPGEASALRAMRSTGAQRLAPLTQVTQLTTLTPTRGMGRLSVRCLGFPII